MAAHATIVTLGVADVGASSSFYEALGFHRSSASQDTFWLAGGASPVKDPEKVFWGGYSSYVADPDGHLWELAHNPHLPLRADGSAELSD